MTHIEVNVNIKRKDFELDVDLALPDTGISIILGPSGSGKSTLLRLIAGLEKPDNGYIRVRDTNWANTSLGICRPPQQRRVGMVFQDYALFNHLTVGANVGFGLPRKGRQERVREWLSRMHLTELAQRYPGIKFVSWKEFGEIHGANEHEVLADLPEKLKQFNVDAVICGVGC